jgi:predicted ester cyclase
MGISRSMATATWPSTAPPARSCSCVYSKVRTGDLPKIPLSGKYVRFRLDVIEAFERGAVERDERRA